VSGRRARLLMVHDYPPVTGGGLALAVNDLARTLADDVDAHVVSSRIADHFTSDRDRPRGAPLMDDGPVWQLVSSPTAVDWLRRADAVIVHWTFSFRGLSTACLLVAPALGKPVIFVIHTAPAHCEFNRLRGLHPRARRLLIGGLRATLQQATAVIALSRSQEAAIAQAGLRVDRIMPLPVLPAPGYRDALAARGATQQLRTLGFAGELSEMKGADELPALWHRLTPDFDFRVAGRGPLGERLQRSVAGLAPQQTTCIVLLDRLEPNRMPMFYASIDFLLILSRTESQCRVALEAMLAGVLVLARKADGIADLIIDGATGFFIDPRDPDAVHLLLERLANNPAQVDAVRERAVDRARLLIAKSCGDWRRLVLETLSRSGVPEGPTPRRGSSFPLEAQPEEATGGRAS
jgi:glycosyltransferase involved in cell wall biosynthesis